MTILEMHIAIDLLLQRINSNAISSIRDEEKDILINQEIIRFINQRSRSESDDKRIGFQGDIKRYEDLKALIKTSLPLTPYVKSTDEVYCFIPSDSFRLLSVKAAIKDLCNDAYLPTTASEQLHYVTYKFLNSGVSNYNNFVYKLDGVTIFDSATYPQFSTGLPASAPEMKFELIQFMLEEIRKAGYEVKYENFRGKFFRESLIVFKTSAFAQTVIYNLGVPVVTNSVSDTVTKVTLPLGNKNPKCRIVPTDEYDDLLESAFSTTFAHSPVVALEGDSIKAAHKQKFIISSLSVNYIRIPRKVSLPLNQSCDLDGHVHQEIVDNLSKRLAAITSAEQYQLLLRENLSKE